MANGKVTLADHELAACAVVEGLLRTHHARRIAIIGSMVSISGVKHRPPGGQQCGPTESYGQGGSLSEAIEELIGDANGEDYGKG